MIKVRFLRAKRYPHPSGPRREAGTTMPITATLAQQWGSNGLVEVLDEPETVTAGVAIDTAASQVARVALTTLRAALADVTDPGVVRAAAELDERKGARVMYAERLEQLGG